MAYIDALADSILENRCPGCGPDNMIVDTRANYMVVRKFCKCCGWFFQVNGPGNGIDTGSFATNPIDGSIFPCVLDYPEHKANWPKPESDPDQPDKFTQEEIEQELLETDLNHPYLTRDEKCGVCGGWAPHKIAEEKWDYHGHPFTSALCCQHLENIFGPSSHRYPSIHEKPLIGEN